MQNLFLRLISLLAKVFLSPHPDPLLLRGKRVDTFARSLFIQRQINRLTAKIIL